MFRKVRQGGWIGLTLIIGMVTGAFLPVSTLAQINSSSSTSDSVSQCTSTQIPLWINRLAVGDVAAFDALVNCGSMAVPDYLCSVLTLFCKAIVTGRMPVPLFMMTLNFNQVIDTD